MNYDTVRGALQPGALVALMGARYLLFQTNFYQIYAKLFDD